MLKLKDEELDINRFPSIMFNAFDRTCDIPGLREISLYHYRPGTLRLSDRVLTWSDKRARQIAQVELVSPLMAI